MAVLTTKVPEQARTANKYFMERSTCPSCTSSSLAQLYESRFDRSPIADYLEEAYSRRGGVVFDQLKGAVYALLQCQDCKLIFQRDVLNEVLMHKLYEDWIDPSKDLQIHLEEYRSDVYGSYAQEIMRMIAHFGKPPSALQVLDFGMGWSEWVLMAKGFGCDAWGTDISDSRIDYARSKGVPVMTGKEKTPLKFDFINTEQVFEHLADPLEALLELKKLLKPGGIIKISVVNSRGMNRRLKHMDWRANRWSRYSLDPVAPLEHINCFQRGSIVRMAQLAGLREVRIPLRTQYRYMVCSGGWRKSLRNFVRPVYRTLLKSRSNYVFFTQ